MSEDEKESFEITDYDLQNEFSMFRNQRRPTKHQQIYGIWAQESDDDEGDRERGTKKYNKPRQKADYTSAIGFVSGGVQQQTKKINAKDNNDSPSSENKKFQQDDANSSDQDSEDERPRFGLGARGRTQATVTEITGDIAGLRSSQRPDKTLMNQGVGKWEKHTKGIGAKLLLQMGYQPGRGLGKDLQGISMPVEAHLRKGRGAIGAYGPEKAASIAKAESEQVFAVNADAEKRRDADKLHTSKWRRDDKNGTSSTKITHVYRSVDDVIEKGKRPGLYRNATLTSDASRVKIIDMTGPQQRVLSGYHALSSLKVPDSEHVEVDDVPKKSKNFVLPEIQHNLDVLLDLCEQDIIRIDKCVRLNEDAIVTLKQEEVTLKKQMVSEEQTAMQLDEVLKIVQQLTNTSLGLSLGQVANIFIDLQEQHQEAYMRYQIRELAPGILGPLITSALASWNPLIQPALHQDIFGQWQTLLGDSSVAKFDLTVNKRETILPYDNLMWQVWFPVIKTCIQSNWNARQCDPLISLLESWRPLLSMWLYNNVLDQLVIPKLVQEVTAWDPLTDTVPIHTWIHPWVPLLDTKLHNTVYNIIIEKLGIALYDWHPSDPSAKLVLEPWQRALPEGTFLSFVLKHIVPKLQLCLQSFQINPHQQHLDGFRWVINWSDMLSVSNMTLLLDKFFFPRWLQTLAMWLNHNPNYTQVTEWYSGWKRMIPEALLQQPTIKENFYKALEMMNRAVNSEQQPGAKESVSYLTKLEAEKGTVLQQPTKRIETLADAVRTAGKIPQGFKDLISRRCEERGILFVPIPNKFHEARQVYRLGSNGTQCYVDRNVVFYSQNNSSTWIPTSLNRLLDLA